MAADGNLEIIGLPLSQRLDQSRQEHQVERLRTVSASVGLQSGAATRRSLGASLIQPELEPSRVGLTLQGKMASSTEPIIIPINSGST